MSMRGWAIVGATMWLVAACGGGNGAAEPEQETGDTGSETTGTTDDGMGDDGMGGEGTGEEGTGDEGMGESTGEEGDEPM